MHSAESLQAEIAAIQDALAHDRVEQLPQMLQEHDAHLREFCRGAGAAAARDGLQQLRAMQQQTIVEMRRYQQKLLGLMRAQRRSGRAARAYLQAGGAR
jgi:hypothetical protein